ncbi:MAG: transcriptional regulator [Bifidobacteriaceae bacterium]|jgi:DNA-binding MarR family transcriptional regulator|nr:transcriptional regulator [Bifidobacteriaceae bacterium]
MSGSTSARFDPEIHAPVRLRVCGALAEVKSVEFASLRDLLGVADSVLSKHLARLEAQGYVFIDKQSWGGHLRTWVGLTDQGRRAFDGHIAALRQIAGL